MSLFDKLTTIVRRTFNTADSFGPQDILHATIGIGGEAGELLDAIKKWQFYGLEPDWANIKEEAADLLYYNVGLILCIPDTEPEDIVQLLQDKLDARYPNGFTQKDAVLKRDHQQTSN